MNDEQFNFQYEAKLDIDFARFHGENPQVYATLRRLALEWTDTGRRHLGISMLWEVMRWQMTITTTDEEFKLNNNHRSRYSRLLMEQEPELEGIFETRTLTSREEEDG